MAGMARNYTDRAEAEKAAQVIATREQRSVVLIQFGSDARPSIWLNFAQNAAGQGGQIVTTITPGNPTRSFLKNRAARHAEMGLR